MNAAESLDEIDRIHDAEPQRAADGLRALDCHALPGERLPLYAFLVNHVLGEKLGAWREAAERLQALRAGRPDAPLAVALQSAIAAELSGNDHGAAFEALTNAAGATAARIAVGVGRLGFEAASATELADRLLRLARESQRLDTAGPLDQRLAAGFNNATSRLLDTVDEPAASALRDALVEGAAAALRFWQRAGTWVQHERALYLKALVHNRIGEPGAARDACTQALSLIAANGTEEVDRAFLQLQLAYALLRLGDAKAGKQLAEARAAAAAWDDEGLKTWFDAEFGRLFAAAGGGQG
jgi:hypothetical protein